MLRWIIVCSAMLGTMTAFAEMRSLFSSGGDSAAEKRTAEKPVDSLASRYPDKASGDAASAAKDYGTAVSFYRKYRRMAERASDTDARKDAFICELDSLLLGKFIDQAERCLADFKKAFPALDPRSFLLWQAEILLAKRQLPEAARIFRNLLSELPVRDPRRIRVLSALAIIAELQKKFDEAAEIYAQLSETAGNQTEFGHHAAEREILALAYLGKTQEALNKVGKMPIADTERDLLALRFLNIFLSLKSGSIESIMATWNDIANSELYFDDSFFYTASNLIGDEFFQRKDYTNAAKAYTLAFQSAVSKEDAFDSLTKMLQCLEKLDQPNQAAELALKQYRMFKGKLSDPEMYHKIARFLFHAKRYDSIVTIYKSMFENKTIPEPIRKKSFDDVFQKFLDLAEFKEADSLLESFYPNPSDRGAIIAKAQMLKRGMQFKKAAELFQKAALMKAPDSNDMMLNALDCLYQAHEYKQVIDTVSDPLIQDENPKTLFLAAISYEALKKDKEAEREFLKCANSKSKDISNDLRAQCLYRTGRIQIRLGKINNAVKTFRQLGLRYPTSKYDEAGMYWLIYTCYLKGDEISAERMTWRLMESYPDSEFACSAALRLAQYFVNAGSTTHAEGTLNKLLLQKKYPKIRARAMYETAILHSKRKEWKQAMNQIEALEKEYPDDLSVSKAIFLKGDILKKQNRFAEAAAAYYEAAKRRPGSVLEQASLGAAADCAFSLAMQKRTPEDYRATGLKYEKLLENKELIPEYSAISQYKAGRCAQLAGDDEKAFDLYKKLIFLIRPEDSRKHVAESVWCAKAAFQMEVLAAKQPDQDKVRYAIIALEWLNKAGMLDSDSIHRRTRALRKKRNLTMNLSAKPTLNKEKK